MQNIHLMYFQKDMLLMRKMDIFMDTIRITRIVFFAIS